jgi:hypothetical protein
MADCGSTKRPVNVRLTDEREVREAEEEKMEEEPTTESTPAETYL